MMSNLSEEEIVDILKNQISDYVIGNYCNEDCKAQQICENNDCYFIQAIDGILDLYNKEKEKNNILENLLQGNLYEMYKYYKDLANSYQANNISKDKIRDEIKELESRINYKPLDNRYTYAELIRFAIEEMKCLMEEKHK